MTTMNEFEKLVERMRQAQKSYSKLNTTSDRTREAVREEKERLEALVDTTIENIKKVDAPVQVSLL